MSEPTQRSTPMPPWLVLACVMVFAAMVQLRLALNPGYFSHDELQWGVLSQAAGFSELPWVGWLDVDTFQWRPLTFNLWLPISHLLFDSPRLFHTLWVLIGSAMATALAGLLLRLGLTTFMTIVAGWAFALNPYAVYVHGWVGTLADLIWVGLALCLAHLVLSLHRRGSHGIGVALIGFALTSLALMAKEAAVVMPALLALTWFAAGRSTTVAWATGGSALAAIGYLALRLDVLLNPSEAAYATSIGFVPRNLMAYVLFPLRPSSFEIQGFLPIGIAQLVVSSLLWLGLAWFVLRVSPRLGLLLLAGAPLALAPVLPLEMMSNQYAYGASAWVVGCVALAADRMRRPSRALVLVVMAVSLWHGQNISKEMAHIGERQMNFHGSLADLLPMSREPLKLYVPESDRWIYGRLTHEVPSWHGIPVAGRLQWVDREKAHFIVSDDGSLQSAQP
ncbi:hypothetical protein [Arenimonas sp. MALMAid1274]|uniref:hypothetical protein n=1 Tax=Arenimonas sp. MALMAid1274 TaxID=3411630 RepID=UPI003BA003D3